MLNKLLRFIRKQNMLCKGDTVVCAVSGGADSVALLWAMYLLRDQLNIQVEAAHFNHNLRGLESDRDETFVSELCQRYDIPLHVGRAAVIAGKKGLEASARNARYSYFQQLEGKIATAHTADDNAETLLMHMIRGTGLKGLGGITPVRDHLIRPMLTVTRQEVLAFLQEYHMPYINDSSNDTDIYLRNRIRHHVMPLLVKENPSFSQSASDMALRLREDETELSLQARQAKTLEVQALRKLTPAIRNRVLVDILESFGVKEPNAEHIALLEQIVFSENPSAAGDFPGNIKIGREYGQISLIENHSAFSYPLPVPGELELKELGLRIIVKEDPDETAFASFVPEGTLVVRSRIAGDSICLQGGTKTLKKLYIDKKIPAAKRNAVPVIADNAGVICVAGVGINQDRIMHEPKAVGIWLENIDDGGYYA